MKKVAIVIDDWKLPIFKRRLENAGYKFENAGAFPGNALVLKVQTTNVEALGVITKEANDEARRTGKPK